MSARFWLLLRISALLHIWRDVRVVKCSVIIKQHTIDRFGASDRRAISLAYHDGIALPQISASAIEIKCHLIECDKIKLAVMIDGAT